jgi:hypothetical protein
MTEITEPATRCNRDDPLAAANDLIRECREHRSRNYASVFAKM